MIPVATPNIPAVWRRVYGALKPAIEHGGEHTEESVFRGLMNGQMILWYNKDAFAVTTWCDYPAGRIAFVLFVGGKDARRWALDAAERMTQWAKDIGAKEIRLIGRKGWRRFFSGVEERLMLCRVIT